MTIEQNVFIISTSYVSKSTMVVPVNIQICKLNIENSINENIHGVPRNFEKKN